MAIFVILFSVSLVLRYGALGVTDQPEYTTVTPTDQPLGAKSSFTLQPETEIRQYYDVPSNGAGYRPYPSNDKKKCPLCDSSIYPYCSEKLLHDACCCTNPYIHDLPYQCKLADCRFLHANSCREHRLIANCCCSDDYRSLLKSFTKSTSSSSSLSNEGHVLLKGKKKKKKMSDMSRSHGFHRGSHGSLKTTKDKVKVVHVSSLDRMGGPLSRPTCTPTSHKGSSLTALYISESEGLPFKLKAKVTHVS